MSYNWVDIIDGVLNGAPYINVGVIRGKIDNKPKYKRLPKRCDLDVSVYSDLEQDDEIVFILNKGKIYDFRDGFYSEPPVLTYKNYSKFKRGILKYFDNNEDINNIVEFPDDSKEVYKNLTSMKCLVCGCSICQNRYKDSFTLKIEKSDCNINHVLVMHSCCSKYFCRQNISKEDVLINII